MLFAVCLVGDFRQENTSRWVGPARSLTHSIDSLWVYNSLPTPKSPKSLWSQFNSISDFKHCFTPINNDGTGARKLPSLFMN